MFYYKVSYFIDYPTCVIHLIVTSWSSAGDPTRSVDGTVHCVADISSDVLGVSSAVLCVLGRAVDGAFELRKKMKLNICTCECVCYFL